MSENKPKEKERKIEGALDKLDKAFQIFWNTMEQEEENPFDWFNDWILNVPLDSGKFTREEAVELITNIASNLHNLESEDDREDLNEV